MSGGGRCPSASSAGSAHRQLSMRSNNILWNLGFQALGLVSVVGAIGFEGKLHASDVATLVNVAIAVPILSLLVRRCGSRM